MKLRDLIDEVETIARNAVHDEADRVASEIRSATPANRSKTRQAVSVRMQGLRASVGLRFARQYSTPNTETHRRFRDQWRRIRPVARQRLRQRLSIGMTNQ